MGFVIPEHAVTHFHLRPGDKVGDFGAGSGHFTKALSRAVGGTGRVSALEIQKELAERLANTARTERLLNVDVVWGDIESVGGSKIGDAALDAVLLSNTLFQVVHKEIALTEIARVLKVGGKLFIIDWTESFAGMGPDGASVVSEGDAKSLAERHSFVFERTFPAGAHHYGLVFRKA